VKLLRNHRSASSRYVTSIFFCASYSAQLRTDSANIFQVWTNNRSIRLFYSWRCCAYLLTRPLRRHPSANRLVQSISR